MSSTAFISRFRWTAQISLSRRLAGLPRRRHDPPRADHHALGPQQLGLEAAIGSAEMPSCGHDPPPGHLLPGSPQERAHRPGRSREAGSLGALPLGDDLACLYAAEVLEERVVEA